MGPQARGGGKHPQLGVLWVFGWVAIRIGLTGELGGPGTSVDGGEEEGDSGALHVVGGFR